MSFVINDNKLLKKYTQIWKDVKNLLNIKSDGEPAYGDNNKYIKTKIKKYVIIMQTQVFMVRSYQKKKLPVNVCR